MLAKNNWLNLALGIFGFYTVFSVMEFILSRYGTKVVSATPVTTHISQNFYWLISFVVALILSLIVIILFCKPRAPLFVGIGILLGGCLAMLNTLYHTILNLDKYFRQEGTAAIVCLLPHLVVIAGALIAFYIAWLSNKIGQSSESA